MDAERVCGVKVMSGEDVAWAETFDTVVYHDQRVPKESAKAKESAKESAAFSRGVRVPEHQGQHSTAKDSSSHCPDLPGTAINDRLCAPTDADLPPGHTYQPYFWISQLAHSQNIPGDIECAMVKSQIFDELSMSENQARRAFNRRFEYRFVDEGQGFLFKDKPINQTGPVKKICLFAKAPIEELSFLGIYSGVMYSLTTKLASVEHDTRQLYVELKKQTPDMMSHHRMVSAIFTASAQGQLTPSIYTMLRPSSDYQHRLYLTPHNGRFTPMHFLNCTQQDEKVNVALTFTTLDTDFGLSPLAMIYSTKKIKAGDQLLIKIMPPPFQNSVKPQGITAERERHSHQLEAQRYFDHVEAYNKCAPNQQISLYDMAPVIYLSDVLRAKVVKAQKTRQARKNF